MATLNDMLVEQAQTNLDNIQGMMQQSIGGKILGKIGSALEQHQKDLQDMINDLLKRKGVITENEYNSYYETLRKTSKGEVQKGFVIQNIGFIILLIGIGAGIYYYSKKR